MIPKLFEDDDAKLPLQTPNSPAIAETSVTAPTRTASAEPEQPVVPRGLFDDAPVVTATAQSNQLSQGPSAAAATTGGLCGLFGSSSSPGVINESHCVLEASSTSPTTNSEPLVNLIGSTAEVEPILAELVADSTANKSFAQSAFAKRLARATVLPVGRFARRRPYLSAAAALALLGTTGVAGYLLYDDDTSAVTVVAVVETPTSRPPVSEPAKADANKPAAEQPAATGKVAQASGTTTSTTVPAGTPTQSPASTSQTNSTSDKPSSIPAATTPPVTMPPANSPTPEGAPILPDNMPSTPPVAPATQSPTMVFLDHADRKYSQGDAVIVRVTSDRAGFVYVFYRQADGSNRLLFPNSRATTNQIAAGGLLEIGGEDSGYRIRIGAPYGDEEVIVAVYDKAPTDGINIQSGQVTPAFLAELSKVRATNPDSIGLATITLHTQASDAVAKK